MDDILENMGTTCTTIDVCCIDRDADLLLPDHSHTYTTKNGPSAHITAGTVDSGSVGRHDTSQNMVGLLCCGGGVCVDLPLAAGFLHAWLYLAEPTGWAAIWRGCCDLVDKLPNRFWIYDGVLSWMVGDRSAGVGSALGQASGRSLAGTDGSGKRGGRVILVAAVYSTAALFPLLVCDDGMGCVLLSLIIIISTMHRFINMVSPLVGVPLVPFFWSTFLGSMPYNFICAQAGELLGELTNTSDILTVSLVGKLLVVSLVSLIPLIWGKSMQRRLKKRIKEDDIELEQ